MGSEMCIRDRPKTPITPATPATARTVSSGVLPSVQQALRKAPSRTTTLNSAGAINAQEEFRKWAVGELKPDLNKSIGGKQPLLCIYTSRRYTDMNVAAAEDFVATLSELGNDRDMITEAVHAVTNKIDSRHFSEEFLRRKKMADKGLVDTSALSRSTASPHNAGNGQAGGWSEVAKKGLTKEPSRDESNGAFRVVPAKKKGGKR